MSYTMTYSSLLDDVRKYIERGFTPVSDPLVYEQLPRMVTLAERRITRDLKVQGFVRAVNATISAGLAVYRKPDRWRDTVSMTIGGVPVFPRSYEYLRSYWPQESETGTPEFYADYDFNHWLITPTPATDTTAQILYYEQPALLGDENQTNWFTEYAPDALLYGVLVEAAMFLKNDARVQSLQPVYAQALQSINNEDLKRITDRTAIRGEA